MIAVFRFSCIALLLLLPWDLAFAQHNHGRRNVLEISYETSPDHDEVLEVAPSDLMLRFNDYVQLVKLTLKKDDTRLTDIGFQFEPQANRVFIHELPPLEDAEFYTAEWAILNSDGIMVYGFFCFSFGPDAQVPTTILNARQLPSTPVIGGQP